MTAELPGSRSEPLAVPRSRWAPHPQSLVVLLVGLCITAALIAVAAVNYDHNEDRLLHLRVQDAGSLIAEAIPGIETPLASATELAQATNDPAQFTAFMKPYVTGSGGLVSASLWTLTNGIARRIAVVGQAPYLRNGSEAADRLFGREQRSRQLSVLKIDGTGVPHVGFAYSPEAGTYVGYEENALAQNRHARVASNKAFANLDYAIYLGHSPRPSNLLSTDASSLPFTGRHASVVVPFGSDDFELVISPTTSLQGTFSESLPWAALVAGVLVSLGAMVLVERLIRRRKYAEEIAAERDRVADENRQLYDEQRGIANTLQRALLPQALPEVPGAQVSARYVAGAAGMEVGGDWYDVVATEDGSFLFVVGDVSGSGLRAATVMAELRFATRAYVAEGATPGEILTKLSGLHSFDTDGHFATVLCGRVDLATHEMVLANAGHLNPLLRADDGCHSVETTVGVPIGVGQRERYGSVRVELPRSGTLLAFTDGLVERRGMHIDASVGRLTSSVTGGEEPLDDLLDRILLEFGPDGFDDDAAILGVRWLT